MITIYAELTDYISAIRGGAHPLDSTQSNVIHRECAVLARGLRAALGPQFPGDRRLRLEFHRHPGNTNGINDRCRVPPNKYKDAAGDVQYQFIGEDHLFTVLGTYIHENQTLDASSFDGFSANNSNNLNTIKLTAEYYYQRKIGGSVGYFNITGSTDPCSMPRRRSPAAPTAARHQRLYSRGELPAVAQYQAAGTVCRLPEVQWPERQQPRRL